MKKNLRLVILFLLIVFVLMGCGNEVANGAEATLESTIATEHVEYKERRENFDKLRVIVEEERDSIITEFIENPGDVYELIEKLYANEDNYVVLWDEAKNLSEKDYAEVVELFKTYQIHDGLTIVMYHEFGERNNCTHEFGTYTINTPNEIVWVQNVHEYSKNEDAVVYEVTNVEEDAFIIIKGINGYWLVEIASTFKEDIYTRRMFDEYHEFLQNQKERILEEFARNPIITQKLLDELKVNESGFHRLLNSAKYLPQDQYSQIMLLVELNQWKDGIQTVGYEKKYFQKHYKYAGGEFVLDSETSMEIVWTQNFEDATEDEVYNTVYEVKNPREDAYLLLKSGTGYQLFRIVAIKNNKG